MLRINHLQPQVIPEGPPPLTTQDVIEQVDLKRRAPHKRGGPCSLSRT